MDEFPHKHLQLVHVELLPRRAVCFYVFLIIPVMIGVMIGHELTIHIHILLF